MLRISAILVLLSFAVTIQIQSFHDNHKKKITKELTKWNDNFSNLDLIKAIDNREYYKIICTQDKEPSILVLSSGQGRFDKFDLMTIVNSNGIELIKILKYRSQYGSEITNKKWLAQFYQKAGKEFIIRKNIDAISGATVSTMGLINEINQVLKYIETIKMHIFTNH